MQGAKTTWASSQNRNLNTRGFKTDVSYISRCSLVFNAANLCVLDTKDKEIGCGLAQCQVHRKDNILGGGGLRGFSIPSRGVKSINATCFFILKKDEIMSWPDETWNA